MTKRHTSSGLLALGLILWLAGPSFANCSERSIDLEAVDAAQARAIARRVAGPDGAVIAGYRDGAVRTKAAFDELPPDRRTSLLRAVAVAYREAWTPAEVKREGDESYMGSPVAVRDHLGRLLYRDSACHGEFVLLTEHQRYEKGFALWEAHERHVVHPLPRRVDMKAVKRSFHRVMSWKPAYFIAWVPEDGSFEIDLARPEELSKLKRFWPRAPRGFRYDVLTNDGRRIGRFQR